MNELSIMGFFLMFIGAFIIAIPSVVGKHYPRDKQAPFGWEYGWFTRKNRYKHCFINPSQIVQIIGLVIFSLGFILTLMGWNN